jgi:hypothetical protein
MDAPELMEWGDYDQATTSESWYQTALICLTITRAFGSNAGARLEDFLPARVRPRDRPADGLDLKARFGSFIERHNAKVAAEEAARSCPPSQADKHE